MHLSPGLLSVFGLLWITSPETTLSHCSGDKLTKLTLLISFLLISARLEGHQKLRNKVGSIFS